MSVTISPSVIHAPPPVLPIGAFTLRPFRIEDHFAWSAYLSDPRTTAHTSWGKTDVATIKTVVERCIAEYSAGVSSRWAVADENDAMVGTCGLSNWSLPNSHAELVYDLAPAHWRRGLMSQAVTQVMRWAFCVAGFNRLHAYVMDSNEGSRTLLEKAGFQREGILREFRIARGTPRNFHLYACLREEWLSSNAATG